MCCAPDSIIKLHFWGKIGYFNASNLKIDFSGPTKIFKYIAKLMYRYVAQLFLCIAMFRPLGEILQNHHSVIIA